MREYLDILQKILDEGIEKESGRANMPNTIGISKADIRMDLSEGFPLLTTKRMFWKGIVHELLWFLRGETNIKYLVDNKVNIWNGDAYRWYLKWWEEQGQFLEGLKKLETIEDFIEQVKQDSNPEYPWIKKTLANTGGYTVGDLGKVYGAQWRNQNGVDQVKDVIDGLKNNPYSRYHIIDAWNKADFVDMALPPCHLLYQFIVRPMTEVERRDWASWEFDNHREWSIAEMDKHGVPKFHLDLNMYQRSCDTFLGVPFNIASMSLLLLIIAKVSNMEAGVANWIGGDTHLYVSHLDAVKEQLSREPLELPFMFINKELNSLEDICKLTIDDFQLNDYEHHSAIKAELFTGLKKK